MRETRPTPVMGQNQSTLGPYLCPEGRSALDGTGINLTTTGGAATAWGTATAPAVGGQEFKLRFTIMDVGDMIGNSTVLIDNFRWIPAP